MRSRLGLSTLDSTPTSTSQASTSSDSLHESNEELQRISSSPDPTGNFNVALLNIGGLGFTDEVVQYLSELFVHENLDILVLTDTGYLMQKHQWHHVHFKDLVAGIGVTDWTTTASGGSKQIGGLTILTSPRLNTFRQVVQPDATGLGVAAAVDFVTSAFTLTVVLTYWTPDTEGPFTLARRVHSYMAEEKISGTLIDFIQALCAQHVNRARSQGNYVLLMGDLNSCWNDKPQIGVYGSCQAWAAGLELTNPVKEWADLNNRLIITRPKSTGGGTFIDHILAGGSLFEVLDVVETETGAAFLSDHLPLVVQLRGPPMKKGIVYHKPAMLDIEMSNEPHCAA